jgi:hypothetical protein
MPLLVLLIRELQNVHQRRTILFRLYKYPQGLLFLDSAYGEGEGRRCLGRMSYLLSLDVPERALPAAYF